VRAGCGTRIHLHDRVPRAAQRRGNTHQRRPLQWWQGLRTKAAQQKRTATAHRAPAGSAPKPHAAALYGPDPVALTAGPPESREAAHERTTLTTASDALFELKGLRLDPNRQHDLRHLSGDDPQQVHLDLGPRDEEAGRTWREEREKLLLTMERATHYIADTTLKELLDQVVTILKCWEEPLKQAGQQEGRTRYLAVEHGLEAVRAFRLGEALPEPSPDYRETWDFVDAFITEWEASRP
jgi:hypothetical protein